ncbi:MAG: hypothetical protein JJU48_02510 [Methylophaga sp.]|nr:hypothetical protein [Methylophaga sp.]
MSFARTCKQWLVLLLILPLMAACASRSQSQYYADEVGGVMSVENVVVNSSRMVRIEGMGEGTRPGWGAAIGATVAGATAYGITEADNPAGIAITIVALVGGALAGQFIDEKSRSSLGVEYILSRDNGDTIAVVQAVRSADERLDAGTPAHLMRGQRGYVRVVPR